MVRGFAWPKCNQNREDILVKIFRAQERPDNFIRPFLCPVATDVSIILKKPENLLPVFLKIMFIGQSLKFLPLTVTAFSH